MISKSLKHDTLGYQLGVRPYTQRVSHGHIPTASFGKQLKEALKNADPAHPELDALEFYFMNHVVAIIAKRMHPLEPLGKYLKVLELYNDVLSKQTVRMFYYLTAICTRESRHNKSGSDSPHWTKAKEKFGPEVWDFHYSIKGSGSMQAVDRFCANPPIVSMGVYTAYLTNNFYTGNYSSSFGGKPWGDIAEVLRKFIHGEFSAEMMLDTAFTLCHNNGPIFNKGMFFDSYSHDIYKILDVQRSGQIPHLIHENKVSQAGNAKTLYNQVVSIMGEDLVLGEKKYVDWFAVEAAGSLHKYGSEKAKQEQLYGSYQNQEKTKQYGKSMTQSVDVAEPKKNGLEILPGVFVETMEVNRG